MGYLKSSKADLNPSEMCQINPKMAKKKSNFGGQATAFLVVLTLKRNPQNTQRVKRLTYDPKRFAVEQRI